MFASTEASNELTACVRGCMQARGPLQFTTSLSMSTFQEGLLQGKEPKRVK